MTSAGGHWVRVRFADATTRLDWIPEAQPPAPDGGPGAWHVVPDPAGGPSRWEWHPGSSPPLPLQAVPNRPRRGPAPSVHPHPKPARSRPARPALPMRWAAWSLSVVLAVPVVYLLARDSGHEDPSPTSAQSDLGSSELDSADESDVESADESATVTGLPGIDPTSTSPDTAADTAATAAEGSAPGDEAVDRYLRHLFELDTAQGYTFSSLGEQYLLTTGTDACGALDRGVSYEVVRQSVMSRIPNGGQLLVASAATYLCPRHHGKLQAFTAATQGAAAQG